jgi:DNA mismatch repair protein MutS
LHEARPGKVVERGVTQVLTPGTLTDSSVLDDKSASYICSFFATDDGWAVIFAEILTGHMFATLIPDKSSVVLYSELSRFMPDEIIVYDHSLTKHIIPALKSRGYFVSIQQESHFNHLAQEQARSWIKDTFSDHIQQLTEKSSAFSKALEMLYTFLVTHNHASIVHFKHISLYNPQDFLMLDASTIEHLDLVKKNYMK